MFFQPSDNKIGNIIPSSVGRLKVVVSFDQMQLFIVGTECIEYALCITGKYTGIREALNNQSWIIYTIKVRRALAVRLFQTPH